MFLRSLVRIFAVTCAFALAASGAQALFVPFSFPDTGQYPHPFSASTVSVTQSWPNSRGSVELRDAGPRTRPSIDPNHFATEEDLQFSVRTMRRVREVLATSPTGSVVSEEYLPGKPMTTDAQILDCLRNQSDTICRLAARSAWATTPVRWWTPRRAFVT